MSKDKDLTLGIKTKPKTSKLLRPDGTYEIIDEDEARKHAENQSQSGTAQTKETNKK
jgi:hypothetical protein